MYRHGGRQFSRGGLGGGQDPPRRRRFRGQYVRRRTPSGGYRAGSFSDDRTNDSSPPGGGNRPPMPNDDRPYNNYQPQQQERPQHHQRGIHHQNRGMRHQNQHQQQQQQQFYDGSYTNRHPRNNQQNNNNQNNNFDMSDSERQVSPQRGDNVPFASLRRVDELARSFQGTKTEVDEIKSLFAKLSTEIDQVKNRVKELESSCYNGSAQQNSAQPREAGDSNNLTEKDKRRKAKNLKLKEKKAAKRALVQENASSQQEQSQKILNNLDNATIEDNHENTTSAGQNQTAATGPSKFNNRQRRERNLEPRRGRRDFKDKNAKRVTNKLNQNDDSTTQAAEPSSEERPEGDDGQNGKERVRVFRRKKPHFGRRGRRAGSSERNSNDTSPQENRRRTNKIVTTYPELSETALNDIVQNLKREFLNLERPVKEIKKTMNEKGPKVVYEFAVAILDHAMCDVTSPTKLSEIANSLYQLIVSEDNMYEVDFQKGFYEALNDLSKREDEISIDAPRYLDTLGSVLAECIVLMSGNKHKNQLRRFLNKCIESYCPKNKANLLANIMKEIAENHSDRFAKDIWDTAQLKWKGIYEGEDLDEFLETKAVGFTTKTFSPEPRKSKKSSKELEKFADDVTSMVEKRCTPEALDEFVKELDFNPDERVEYLGTLIYAIVRGCLVTESGTYKLDNEALDKYSSLVAESKQVQGEQVAIALHALTALTKLWHHHNCPQDLFRSILLALHNQGTASYEALNEWLNSESLTNIPGIGAARLSSKRYIEDLAATQKSS